MARKEISSKDFIHGNFIKEVEPRKVQGKTRTHLHRRVLLRCLMCGKEFTVDLHNALRVQQKYCGAACKGKALRKLDIPSEEHPLYSRWLSMRQRCLNPNSDNTHNYHDRGITIEPYLLVFKNYVEYVSQLPGYKEPLDRTYQLDRINNNKGYERGNLRWVTMSIQAVNKRPPYNGGKYSKHCGICFNIAKNRWVARLKWQGKVIFSKTFLTEQEAYEARKQFILENKLPHYID